MRASNEFHPQGNTRVDRDMRRARKQAQQIALFSFLLRIAGCIAVGLFCYITMVTGQMADWIAIPVIFGCLIYGPIQIDRWFEKGGRV